jgi:Pyruvate/2-oxoacid:ferredoxin oxidoreductase delta subunit
MEIGVYLTDLNLQNIAYDENNKSVYIIDVENVILVDKQRIREENPNDWNMTYYVSTFDKCGEYGDCLTYEPESLCNNYHADLNYYSGKRKPKLYLKIQKLFKIIVSLYYL